MRTKTLLATAAALAAAVTYSQAQNTVYSQNVVGYVNLSIPAGGLQMVANQLDTGSNTLDNVFQSGVVSTKSFVLEWNGTGYNQYEYYNCADSPLSEPGWYSGNTEVGHTNYLQPGQGVFFHNTAGSAVTIPTVGQVIQGTNTYSVPVGLNIYSIPQPLAGLPLDNTNINFPVVSTKTYYLAWTGSGYNQYEYYNCSDSPLSEPGFYSGNTYEDSNASVWPNAGGSFFIHNEASTASTWTDVFEVQ
ncbi:MAG TPA: hypothetical protein VMF08_17270 [Candidatus Sulfotelmatobacter sp.]|nr:hypothetical protein [Candidatus Sulfotelmatobacter sp.]